MIIDAHAHIYPAKIAEKAVKYIGEFYSLETVSGNGGTAEDLIARGKKGGIDRFLILPVAQLPSQTSRINDFTAQSVADNPELLGFGTIHRDTPDIEAEIERLPSLGLLGVKCHPDMQEFDIDDPKLFPVYDLLSAKKMPINIHCGDYRHKWSHPEKMARVLKNFPKLTVIAAHFGGWSLFDLALEYLIDTGCYVDTSSSLPFLGKKRSEELVRAYGAERVLFGSDYPMFDPAETLGFFNELELSASERELILSGNLNRILGL